MREKIYNRDAAVAYAEKWALGRNPAYYSFNGLGGDCTNFAAQCIFAGSGVMNYTPATGWFYISANDRTPSWTGVEFLYRFIVNNRGAGPYARIEPLELAEPGDIVQLGRQDNSFYHSPVIVGVSNGEIYVATHTYDSLWRPLSSYVYDRARLIHILGVRNY